MSVKWGLMSTAHINRADAVRQARTIEALYEAADNGRTVRLF